MIEKIPRNNRRFIQTNVGDVLSNITGNVWSSRNLNFEVNSGKVRPSERVFLESTSAESDNPQDLPVAIVGRFRNKYWAVAGDHVYQSATPVGDFEEDTETGAPADLESDDADMKIFGNGFILALYVASGTKLYKRGSTSWTTVSSGLDNSYKLLEVFRDHLYIKDDDLTIVSVDEDADETLITSGDYTLDLDISENQGQNISCMVAGGNGLWIGTYNDEGGIGRIIFWDGVTANNPTAYYDLPTNAAMAMTVKDGVPYVLDSRGVLLAFTGSFFKEVGRLEFDDIDLYRFDVWSSNDRFIHPNGMKVVRNEILMNINTRPGDSNDISPLRAPSGIYAYNENIGVYHKFSLGAQTDSATLNDYGMVKLKEAGAIMPLDGDTDLEDRDKQMDFMAGYSFAEDNSTTRFGIAFHDKRGLRQSLDKVGVLVTPEMYAEQMEEMWKGANVMSDLKGGKIVISYRKKKYDPVEVAGTYTSTTTFTSTDASWSTIKTNFDTGVEYQVEGMEGVNTGYLAHITDLTESGGTYTITVDETLPNSSGTGLIRVDRWKKLAEMTETNAPDGLGVYTFNEKSHKVQYKLYFVNAELEQFISVSSNNRKYQ